jgi:Uma2 family endonuclease
MRSSAIRDQIPRVSLEEFLSREVNSATKHEFHDGLVTMMAGGSPEHALIAAQVIAELAVKARGSKCRVFTSDMAIWIPASKTHLYPDASIVCGKWEVHGSNRTQVTNPKLIVEILSPSTRDYDLSAKFSLYQAIPALEEYLAFETDKPELHYWSKGPGGKWTRKRISGMNATVSIRALAKALSLSEIYGNQ